MNLTKLCDILGVDFDKIKPALTVALTHSSYGNEHHCEFNERLEYLGDAVLELCMSTYLYYNYSFQEGVLTQKRAQAVREEALAIYAKHIELNSYLLLGNGEEKTGGRYNQAIIADAFEAVLGAIYVTYGFNKVYGVFEKIVLPHLNEVLNIKDYKSIFQEEMQSEKRNIHYEIVKESGPANDKLFEAVVYVDGLIYGEGVGKTKKEAEQKAAKEALLKRAK